MRKLIDLLEKEDPAWPLIQEWMRSATNQNEVLPAADPQRAEALVQLQVTTRSPMGAVVYETGGILVDHGWLRLLGSGHPRLPRSLPRWNLGKTWTDRFRRPSRGLGRGNLGKTWTDPQQSPPLLLVADDVVGGFFALNGGALSGAPGSTFYFAPDTLAWEDLGFGYTGLLQWAHSGDLARFYAASRWPGWQAEVEVMHGGQALSIYPFLWAKGPPVGERSRGPVPIEEIYSLQQDIARQLRGG